MVIIQIQEDYHLPDELFREIFDACVLLNEDIDITSYVLGLNSPVA